MTYVLAAADDPAQDSDAVYAGVLEAYAAYFNTVPLTSLVAAGPGESQWLAAVRQHLMPKILTTWTTQFGRWAGSVPDRIRNRQRERYAADALKRLSTGFPDYVGQLAAQIAQETPNVQVQRARLSALMSLQAPSADTRRRMETLAAQSLDPSLSAPQRRSARLQLEELRQQAADDPEDRQWLPWARVVADTEAAGAFNGGTFAGNQAAGRTRKTWRSEHDTRTRATHRSANGQTVPIDQPFNVGGSRLLFPGDPVGPPEETYSCRCYLEYR